MLAGTIAGAVVAGMDGTGWIVLPILAFALVFASLAIVPPGQTSVVQFFGRYIGTIRRPGFWWVLAPLTVRHRVSVRVRNFETSHLKVNDKRGNPVEIAAVVVWRVPTPPRPALTSTTMTTTSRSRRVGRAAPRQRLRL